MTKRTTWLSWMERNFGGRNTGGGDPGSRFVEVPHPAEAGNEPAPDEAGPAGGHTIRAGGVGHGVNAPAPSKLRIGATQRQIRSGKRSHRRGGRGAGRSR